MVTSNHYESREEPKRADTVEDPGSMLYIHIKEKEEVSRHCDKEKKLVKSRREECDK